MTSGLLFQACFCSTLAKAVCAWTCSGTWTWSQQQQQGLKGRRRSCTRHHAPCICSPHASSSPPSLNPRTHHLYLPGRQSQNGRQSQRTAEPQRTIEAPGGLCIHRWTPRGSPWMNNSWTGRDGRACYYADWVAMVVSRPVRVQDEDAAQSPLKRGFLKRTCLYRILLTLFGLAPCRSSPIAMVGHARKIRKEQSEDAWQMFLQM